MTTRIPLSESQTGIWYAQRLDPDNPIYNTGQYLEIEGPLHVEAFRQAVNQAHCEAPALSVRVIEEADETFMVRGDCPALQIHDLRDTPNPYLAAQERIAADMSTPLDPTCDALVAERLFVLGDEHYIWYQRIHHLVIDGYGVSLMTRRICDLYSARALDRPPQSAALGSYEAVLEEQSSYRNSAKWEADRAFWHGEFQGRPAVQGIARGNPITGRTYRREPAVLPPGFGDDLQRRSINGVAWTDIVVALTAAFIQRHAGGPEAIVGVPTMNRMGSASARVPAMIMNVLPVRVAIDEDALLEDWFVAITRKLRMARRHGKYRSEQLRRDLGLLGGERRLFGPLINILPFEDPPALSGCRTQLHVLGTGAVDDLTFTIRADATAGHLHAEIDANPNLYSEDELRELAARYAGFLTTAVRAERLSEVETLTPEERQRWVYEVNDTVHPVEQTTLTELIERIMRNIPHSPAVSFGTRTITYAELDALTAGLAHRLIEAGAQPGDIVAVAAPRSLELVLALVATLRVGAAYLPLDVDYPRERLATMLASAAPKTILTFSHLVAKLPERSSVILLDDAAGNGRTDFAATYRPRPQDAAYVIYTSGSTGTPKGVVNQHRGIVNRLEWMRTHYGITSEDRILQKTPATFDVSVWEFFLPLTAGATLVVAPPDAHKDPAWLAAILREERITTTHFVPSMLAAFVAEPQAQGLRLQRVFCSGEELPARLRNRFHEVIHAELHNLYGPTEAAVDVTWWPASRDDTSAPVPIGFPVWNTQMYVLDQRLRPVPATVAGDLYIGGVQVARGYLGRPDLTSERFIDDPFRTGGRMYRTGDLAYRRRDGALVFLGRSDHQVKIRGQRIELGEIEAAIQSSGEAAQVAVIAREDRPGDQRIVAYITPRSAVEPDIAAIREHVARLLPDYMVPSSVLVLEQLPVNSSGKLDRAALPAPEIAMPTQGRAPATPGEHRLARIFAEALGLPEVGVEDDFFTLGGHSLLAARVMSRVREEWGLKAGLGVLFAEPTVARLAAHLDSLDASQAAEGLNALIPLVRSDRADSPALFCVHPAGGISWCYAALARSLDPVRSVYGLQARGLLEARLPDSMEEMAADYVEQIRLAQPQGPYHLAGWSVGGMIAQEMAVQLRSLNLEVGVLAMLDSYPSDCWRNAPEPDEAAALKAILHIAGQNPAEIEEELTRPVVARILRAIQHPLGELSDAALDSVLRVVLTNNRLVREHYHRYFDGTLLHFRASLDHEGKDLFPEQWAPYVARIKRFDIPYLHAHMTSSSASSRIAAILGDHF